MKADHPSQFRGHMRGGHSDSMSSIGMMMTHGQNPAPSPDSSGNWKDAILHACMAIEGAELAGADVPKPEPMRSAYLTLNR